MHGLSDINVVEDVSLSLTIQAVQSEAIFVPNMPLFSEEFVSRFSSLRRLINVVSYVLRLRILRKSLRPVSLLLSTEEVQYALNCLIRLSQAAHFSSDIDSLQSSSTVPLKSILSSFQPFFDDDMILRRNCRLENSLVPYSQAFPIILHHNSPLSKLIIFSLHLENFHCSANQTMMLVRNNYWITRFRRCVRSIVLSCNHCRRLKAIAPNPPFAPLPADRVRECDFVPFSVVGLDYIGPFLLKSGEKAYILLFTCARIRAIHLEVVCSMDYPHFVVAFDLFCSRRGVPKVVISDNFKTFKLASTMMRSRFSIEWKFNTPKAPWCGGFFERLVKSVKAPLRTCLKSALKNVDAFRHIVTKVEFLVNSRPLTCIDSSFNEMIPLCPNDFLLFFKLVVGEASCDNSVRKMFLKSLGSYKSFWYRWRNEYIRMLSIANRRVVSKNLKPGDVVLLNEGAKHSFNMCRVLEVYPGKDSHVRSARIKTSDGKCLVRPVKLLNHFEMSV